MTTYASAGTTTYFAVSYDSSMGAAGLALANGILATCDADWQRVSDAFSGLKPSGGQIQVKVEQTTGGGSNDLVNNVDIRTGTDLQQARYVLVSEVAEIFMHAQGGGWDPLNSKGEALSRLLGEDAYPSVPGPDGYLTASSWLNSARADFVTSNEATDRDFTSTGCAILFLSYLRNQLGMPLPAIIADRSTTLQGIYKNLTGLSDAFGPFSRLLQRHFPAGTAVNLPNENPFPFPALAEGAGVALANQTNMKQLDALCIDIDGAVCVAWVTEEGPWHVPLPITRAGVAPSGGAIALAHQTSMNQLDAVFVGNDGAVAVMWVTGEGSWNGPQALTKTGFAHPGGCVALANQTNMNQLDAVFVGSDGAVYVMWVIGEGKWQGPAALTKPGFAPAGGCIALAHQTDMNQLDAFLVGNDGALHVLWVQGEGNWQGPAALTGANFARPGGAVAARNQSSANQLDVTLVGNDGAIHVLWVIGEGAWQGPAALTGTNFALPGAALAMANQTNMNQLDVVLVGANGAVQVLWVQGEGKWQGPEPLSAPDFAKSGASIALAHQTDMNQLDAMLVGNNGALSVLWVQGEGKWQGPNPLPQPLLAA